MIEPRFDSRPARSAVTVLTELSRSPAQCVLWLIFCGEIYLSLLFGHQTGGLPLSAVLKFWCVVLTGRLLDPHTGLFCGNRGLHGFGDNAADCW